MTCGCTKMKKEEAERMQGVTWAPPRNISKRPDWEEARERVESGWRLVPEGKAEVAEIIVVSDAVEGTFVDLDGESRLEQVEAKLSGRGRDTHSTRVRRIKVPKGKRFGWDPKKHRIM